MAASKVLVITGAGGMGAAVARRSGAGGAVVLADVNAANLEREVGELSEMGYDAHGVPCDVSDKAAVSNLVEEAARLGPITQVVHTAGLSPVQASAEAIFKVDLYGFALMLDAFGAVVAPGGSGVFIASMAGTMFPLDDALVQALATTPTEELLGLEAVSEVTDPGHAYSLAKRGNQARVEMACGAWGARGARVNSISPGIIATPMGNAELAGPNGDGMRMMIDLSASKRVGTPEDIAMAVEFLLGPNATFITGTDLLVDGGAVPFVKSMAASGALG
jgi:NAD(P)-dependent dehydrogenase (short-subunit alcohol dehydrogenase family)